MLNALVLAHYNFKNDKGKDINTTKLRVSLKDFGFVDICTDKANNCELLTTVKVKIGVNERTNKLFISELEK